MQEKVMFLLSKVKKYLLEMTHFHGNLPDFDRILMKSTQNLIFG